MGGKSEKVSPFHVTEKMSIYTLSYLTSERLWEGCIDFATSRDQTAELVEASH